MFSKKYCGKFGNIFIPDGKYISVKGYDRKIAFLWGVDYFKHDFPVILLSESESYEAWNRYFRFLKEIASPQLIVCDDNTSLKMAAYYNYPKVKIQACYNHFKEGIRRNLKTRSDPRYKNFMNSIEELFLMKRTDHDFERRLFGIFKDYRDDEIAVSVLLNIEKNLKELRGFKGISNAPTTTNIIESFNSHLESRLRSIHKFESFTHARLWLNAYVLKRRYTKFTHCTGRFIALNGLSPIEISKNKSGSIPVLF
jgi:transposase-like protein